MNEQLRQRAQEIADEHGNDAYGVALAMLEESKVTQDRLDRANREISRLSLENTIELRRIKAEAVREAIEECRYNGSDGQGWESDLEQHANKLENQND